MVEQASFAAVALLLLFSASRVVASRNLVHTVLWLGVTLSATAVVFVMLSAPFLAAIQLILYTGGLLTLMLFGIMLTQRDEGFVSIPSPSHRMLVGGIVAATAFGMLAGAVFRTPSLPSAERQTVTTQQLGEQLFTTHALAFELLALLLLAATLGAIVLARKADAGSERELPTIPERKPLLRPSEGEGA